MNNVTVMGAMAAASLRSYLPLMRGLAHGPKVVQPPMAGKKKDTVQKAQTCLPLASRNGPGCLVGWPASRQALPPKTVENRAQVVKGLPINSK